MLINGVPQLCLSPPPIQPLNPKPSVATASSPATDAGLLFRKKLIYLSNLKIDVQKALTQNPNLRATPISSIQSVENCLSSMGLHRRSVGRILDMFPILLTSDTYADLYPVFDFLLNEVEIPYSEVAKSINRCPRILACGVESQLRPTFEFLKSIGFVGRSAITPQTTVLLVYNVESTLKRKIECLKGLGFEESEVNNMVVRSPGLLTFSVEENLVPKFEYFTEEMKGDLEELKSFPQYFSFSLEGRIKPRHRMLMEYGVRLPLPKMLRVSDGEFGVRLIDMKLVGVKEVLDGWT